MATWDDVRRVALALPDTEETASRQWRVHGKLFVWERPLRARDREELGDAAPDGEIVGLSTADEGEKRVLVADEPDVFLTTHHFDGYAAVLARLDRISVGELEEVVQDAWLARAPRRLARAYLDATE